MNRFQKTDALFPTRSSFLAFVCGLARRMGVVALEHVWQGMRRLWGGYEEAVGRL